MSLLRGIGILYLGCMFNIALNAAEVALLPVSIHTEDKPTLQRGAKLFMNYCSGCHSLRFMRYNRMAEDLGLTSFSGEIDTDLLYSNLIFTQAKMYDPIQISLPEVDARQWFGRMPPDLSLTARERGTSWIYTYLKSFYIDKKRPFGSNNLLVPDVSMPNVLVPLSGSAMLRPTPQTLIRLDNGEMTPQQFDHAPEDLVTFLSYVAEPYKATRYHMGLIVLPFLFLLLIVVYFLKKQYWKKLL